MVPPASHGIPRVPRYSGSCSLLPLFTYTTLTSFGGPSHALRLRFRNANRSPQPRKYFYSRFGLCRVRSPLLAVSRLISFLALLRCFSSGGSPHMPMDSAYDTWTSPCGFLHSEIRGSLDICSSPRLIAACHVLRRLPVPRHSPCALSSLTMRYITCFLQVMRESLLFLRQIL